MDVRVGLTKKAEHQRIDAFELWYWRRLLRVPWTTRRSNQSILKEISPEYSLEGLMLKLKLQYFGHLMWKNWLIGKDWRQEEKGTTEDEMVGWCHWLNGQEQTPGVGNVQGSLACCSPWGRIESDMTEWLNCPFLVSRGHLYFWGHGPFPHLRRQSCSSFLPHWSSCKDPCDDIQLTQVSQGRSKEVPT